MLGKIFNLPEEVKKFLKGSRGGFLWASKLTPIHTITLIVFVSVQGGVGTTYRPGVVSPGFHPIGVSWGVGLKQGPMEERGLKCVKKKLTSDPCMKKKSNNQIPGPDN